MRQLTIQDYEAGQRLDHYLSRYLKEAGKGFLYKMLRKKNITLNGKKADGSEKLAAGDAVRLFLSEETLAKFMGTEKTQVESIDPGAVSARRAVSRFGELSVLYEDADVIFVNKPAGMLSQKAKPEDISLCEILTERMLAEGSLTEESLRTFRPAVCNRLDRNTSGLITAGKTTRGLQTLSELFRKRGVDKYYLCVAAGRITSSSRVKGFLIKDDKTNTVHVSVKPQPSGSRIETEYRPLDVGEGCTLLEVRLITGKTHQIRAHLASLGHPVLGDGKYGEEALNREFRTSCHLRRQLLHAYRLDFPADTGELPQLAGRSFTAPPPADFSRCLRLLRLDPAAKNGR